MIRQRPQMAPPQRRSDWAGGWARTCACLRRARRGRQVACVPQTGHGAPRSASQRAPANADASLSGHP